MDLDLLS